MRIKFLMVAVIFSFAANAQTLNDALRLTDNEQYDVAEGVYKTLIQAEPKNGTYWFYYGDNFWKWENPDSAKVCYEKGLQVEPPNPLNLVGIGKALLEQNKIAEAKSYFDKAIATAGAKLPQVQMETAEAFITSLKNKDLNYALTLLQKAAAADSKNPEVYILIGDAYTEQNDGSSAAENYNKALDLNKNLAKAVVRKGVLYKRSTNYEGAQAEFENAIKIDSMFAPAHRELGEIYFRLRKLDMAKNEYRKYLELSKNTSTARLRYASFLFLSKDFNGTLNEINQLKKMDPENLSLLRLSGYTYYEMNDSVKALQTMQKVFEKVEESKRTQKDYNYYAKSLAQNAQDSLAVIIMQKAYDMDSTNTDLLSDMGTLLMKMKRYAEAAEIFQKRVDLGKGVSSTDYYNLGKAYSSSKQLEKSDSALAKVNELLPTWSYAYLLRAQVNANIDSTSERNLAKPYYEKYLEIVLADTQNFSKYKNSIVEAYRYLGYYYYRQNQLRESKEYWRKILDIIPNDKQSRDVIDGLEQPKKKE
ncbi:MAG TPA: tetratricopeptide repeat protein [Bacteroidia bacterium]|nr:tetratricopeptide repeat protein [Bacteroidia bacterium]